MTEHTTKPELELRQEPLPKAHDPFEWTGWPLFAAYGLTGDGRPASKIGKQTTKSGYRDDD